MARASTTSMLRPSVLDRLLEAKGNRSHPAIGLRELHASVARDLEWLLNTKCNVADDENLKELSEVLCSNLTYGIPDFSTASWRSDGDAVRICRDIETAVTNFEPRLVGSTVRVTVLDPSEDVDDFKMRFRIEGTLYVEPISEPVYFDSSVETDTGAIHVEGGG